MKLRIFSLAACLALSSSLALADEQPSMISTMGDMQLFLHKLYLSVQAGNHELAGFYAHELEEAIEDAQDIDEYDDIKVGELTTAMLVPAFEALEGALDEQDASAIEARMEGVISSCNACHQATGYGFIHIQPGAGNPYFQSFEPRD